MVSRVITFVHLCRELGDDAGQQAADSLGKRGKAHPLRLTAPPTQLVAVASSSIMSSDVRCMVAPRP
jgi:hypothetical protein